MAMGHRDRLIDGDEYDVVSKWRHVMCWCHKPGAKSRVKRKIRRRTRRQAKENLRNYDSEEIEE